MQTEFPLTAVKTTTPDLRLRGSSLVQKDERLLMEYAETGKREAFEELVRLYEKEIYNYLRRYIGDAQLAEDAFQATFLQLHLKCRQFEPGRPVRPWLYTIANHQAVDILRRNRRHKAASFSAAAGGADPDDEEQPLGNLLETAEIDPSERLIQTEDREWARSAVKTIPARVRQVLILFVYQGLRYREIAEVLGIPLGTVKSRMSKALRSLHEGLITTRHIASQENR